MYSMRIRMHEHIRCTHVIYLHIINATAAVL